MASIARRRRPRDTNIWPGFVDALATLLMVIIFVLMIFIVAQFYLTQTLSGRDEALERLNRQVSELSELLALERDGNAELRFNMAQLSEELQASIASRDRLSAQVNSLLTQRDQMEDRLAIAVSERAGLQQRIVELESSGEGLNQRLTQVLSERDGLLAKLRAVEEDTRLVKTQRDEAGAGLDDALKIIDANRDTIELQLRDLESLRRDLAALKSVRKSLEVEVAEMLAIRELLQTELVGSEKEREALAEQLKTQEDRVAALLAAIRLKEGENTELTDKTKRLNEDLSARQAALAEALANLATESDRSKLLEAAIRAKQSENTKLTDEMKRATEDLEARRIALSEILAKLGSERDRSKLLEAALASETERTLLSQKEIKQRDIRLEELLSQYDLAQTDLTEEQKVSAEAQRQVKMLNQQLTALRLQLASLQEALDASDVASAAQNVKILDLGKRLNKALASKVQELARFRSEFFGRLRDVLKGRKDIRIVGDRFVFQSEVLFSSGSADIGPEGHVRLADLAAALIDIAERIPSKINWILQIEGHTDSVPIFNERFSNNWDLSSARAISVVEFLITQGIPASRLSATGYGEFQPIDQRSDEIGNRRNRRIELKLTQR
ncbi:MAG: peptidoglycan -binding protein [Rhodospirillaceae bacterium]|nr:peptidoglycan -binding protein [Rhodospirillaceae bacterium]